MPRSCSSCSAAARSRWPISMRPAGCSRSRASPGTGVPPNTTGIGWCGSSSPPSPRAVSEGSSASTVPVPTAIASWAARCSCTRWRAAVPVIHWLVPSAAAARPSSVEAHLTVTKGRPSRTLVSHGRRSSSASSARTPPMTSTPAARRRSAPPPAIGLGSSSAYTTRATPASMRACAQGPVRPVWLQGSSVTTAVRPVASATCARASTSAWSVPAPRCQPSATIVPAASSSTQPTCGFSPTAGPWVARLRARRIAATRASSACGAAVRVIRGPRVDRDASGVAREGQAAARVFLPSGLSPSAPEFHRFNRSRVASITGRGLSPPARIFTDPGTRTAVRVVNRRGPGVFPNVGWEWRAQNGPRARCAGAVLRAG